MRIKPGVYVVEDADRNGVLQIAADDVVVDFRGATLASRKNVQTGDKEQYDGIGVAVGAHERVVVKDAKIYGYRFNLKAEGCEQLLIENCDCSHSQRSGSARMAGRSTFSSTCGTSLPGANTVRRSGWKTARRAPSLAAAPTLRRTEFAWWTVTAAR